MADRPKAPKRTYRNDVERFLAERGPVQPLTQIRDYDAWKADRARRGNPAYGNSYGGGGNSPVQPTMQFDPQTGKMVPTGGMPSYGPSTTSTAGTGSVQAGQAVASKAAAREAQTSASVADVAAAYGITPEIGRQMLREGAAYMQGISARSNATPPGFFEEHFKDKATGKALDGAVKEGGYRLSQLMDYEDEADLSILGFNLAPVEWAFDRGIESLVLLHDTTMWGASGALLAANPHYWRNRDQGQLGNLWQDATQVSPGRALQALASPVQDLLGENPATLLGPLAGPLAPVYNGVMRNFTGGEKQGVYSHDPDFDITEQVQRDEWFGNTPQKIGSGVGDAVIGTVLDPTIFLGKGAQIARLRFLDQTIKGTRDVERIGGQLDNSHVVLDNVRTTVDDVGVRTERNIEDLLPEEVASTAGLSEHSRLAYLAVARKETEASKAARAQIEAIEDAQERAIREADFIPEYEKRFNESTLFGHHLLQDMTNRDAMSQALNNAQTYEQAELLIRHASGDRAAAQALDMLAPELYMHVLNGERKLVQKMVRSDPTLVAAEVAKWEDRVAVVRKRIDELVDLKADDSLIGKHRAMLSELEDALDYAKNAERGPVGAGPAVSQAEIDLARRSIDNQLKNNYLFERSIRDAEGGEHLFGAFSSRTKGTVAFAEGLDPESAMGKVGAALDRSVANSRISRAQRSAAVKESGGFLGAVKTGWSREFYGIDRKTPIARVLAVPTRVAGVLEAGARYGWVEKPSGLIHTAGVSAQESSREIRAVVNSVRMFHQPARQGRDGQGNLLYRTKDGRITTKATGAKGVQNEPLMVGGKEHGERIVSGYLESMLLGSREAQSASREFIDKFEIDMLESVAYYHGIDIDKLRDAHYRINERLQDIEKQIKEQRYWTDSKQPTRNYAPWLETHLQNSTFMKNWRSIDHAAYRLRQSADAAADGATLGTRAKFRIGSTKDFTEDLFDSVDGGIQSVWRPMVLARGGYTIRNTAEGLFRSTAFLFSLAPIFNTANQLAKSTQNVAYRAVGVSRRASRQVEAAKAGAGFSDLSPSFQRWRNREVTTAETEMEATRGIVAEQRALLAENNALYRAERMRFLDNEQARLGVSSAKMREIIDEVDAVANPTPAQVADRARAQAVLDLNEARVLDHQDEWETLSNISGGATSLNYADRELMDTLEYLENVDIPYRESQLTALSDPTLAAMAYRNQTMAKRRVYGKPQRHITDTDTMATLMKGRATADAFNPDDTYTNLALQNLSADGTVRQTAAMRMQAITGGMTAYEMRTYVDVRPGEPGYFDGVATAVNQIMNSDIGQIMIRGRADGRFDDEIALDIVRFLYSDEGAPVAAWLNDANEGMFGAAGRFEGLSAQARAEMVERTRANTPLYEALDDAQSEYRAAGSIAGDAKWRMPRARFEGDSPSIPTRKWDGNRFGDYEVETQGRGRWTVTYPDGTVENFTKKTDARARARTLQTADDDITRAHWTLDAPVVIDGHTFSNPLEIDEFLAAAKKKRDDARAAVDKAEGKPLKIRGTGSREHVGQAITPELLRKRLDEADSDMQDAYAYALEVLRRYDQITNNNADLQRYIASVEQLPIGGGNKPTAAGDIMRSFLTDADGNNLPGLEPVIGTAAQWVGTNSAQNWYRGKTQKLFRLIGTVPEDLLVRAPFYGKVFKDEAARMYDLIAAQKGGQISLRDVNTIREMAHRRALKDTKQWLYTIDRRTTFADAAERVVPFASAMQNGVTTVGRLAWHDPSIPGIMARIWQSPDDAGWTDEEDNVHVPIGWVPKGIREQFGLQEEFVFSKKSADLILNGWLEPGAPPLIAMPASELMKNSFFGTGLVTPDTPGWLSWMGDTGDFVWDRWKAYAFGEDFGASQETASWDKLFAPWLVRGIKGLVQGVGSSAAFGNTFSAMRMADAVKVYSGEKESEAPYEEIVGMTTAVTVARSLAQLLFLPVAPVYPSSSGDIEMTAEMRGKAEAAGLGALMTIGDAIRKNDEMFYADQARIANAEARSRAGEMIDPDELLPQVKPSEELFGEAVWRAYKVHSKDNTAGLPSTEKAAKFVRSNQSLIASISTDLERHDMLDVIGMFGTDPNAMYSDEYDANAQAFFLANRIPGTNENYREVEDPKVFEEQAVISAGWKVYMKAIDALELDAMRNGVTPPFSANSQKESLYYARKQQIEAYVDENYPNWAADKAMRDSRADLIAEKIVVALKDEEFNRYSAADPVWRKGGYADIYVTERKLYIDNLAAIKADMRANGIMSPTDGRAEPWVEMQKQAEQRWAKTQMGLRRASPSWQAIQDRYLGDDLDPERMSESLYDDEEETP